jgi:UDP-N-acetylglucosamine--N-acetylmuramyl-(pentapeptide) pyrophosphoryl-undecaprenol N-acetylglucosamine transferase
VRPAVVRAAATAFEPPRADSPFRLLVFGGSQGAHVMAEIVPAAVARLEPSLRRRLEIVQQARSEDLDGVRGAYGKLAVKAEVAPFFDNLPERIAASHLVVSRSGASTVAELAAIGRPAVLVPLPHALDQDQAANAMMLERAGGAVRMPQDVFTPERLAGEIAALAADPARLLHMAAAAKSVGVLDAAGQLADLVLRIAGIPTQQ